MPVMQAIAATPSLELQVITAGTMVLERFQKPNRLLTEAGFPISAEIYMELEGSNPLTMAKSVGLGIIEFSNHYERLKPDVVLVIGDRYEALAAVVAAAYMNLCIAHIQGGEVTGSIDESARHAISKFAHFHFPSTRRSTEYLVRMGERTENILAVGCPSADVASKVATRPLPEGAFSGGSGAEINPERRFLLVLYHPTTTVYGQERAEIDELLAALNEVKMPTVMLWPNIDAGGDHISKAIRIFRDRERPAWLRLMTNFEPDTYLAVLNRASCAIGNSSSFVRDASFLGTPIVLVGQRQAHRETGEHVRFARPVCAEIVPAIKVQLEHGRYDSSELYGRSGISSRIAECLADLKPYVQKHLAYADERGQNHDDE